MPSTPPAVRARWDRVRSINRQGGPSAVVHWAGSAVRTRWEERRHPHTPIEVAGRAPASPRTSVLVPVRNDQVGLGRQLRAVQDASFAEWECIVVDDASTDDSVDVAQRFALVDPRFRVFEHGERRGRDAAVAAGVQAARGVECVVIDPSATGDVPADLDASTARPALLPAGPGAELSAREIAPHPEEVLADEIDLDGAVVLVGESPYHLEELAPLADVLRHRGHRVEYVLPAVVRPALLRALGRVTPTVAANAACIERARALVVMNDWADGRALVRRADDAGVPTFAKVEGVQDFDDVDTGRVRRAYRTASVVLAQGAGDVAALSDCETAVVGSTRIERLMAGAPAHLGDTALVNVNFTYGVLADRRDRWLSSVRLGCDRSAFDALVSRHPADTGPVAMPVSRTPFRHDVLAAAAVISRFSTVAFDAMALGVPFVYHNPHGEQVPTFAEPDGAFAVTVDDRELCEALEAAVGADPARERTRSRGFLERYVDVDPLRPSEERTADVLEGVIGPG